MARNRRRRLGQFGVLGGLGLIAYVLLKQFVVPGTTGMAGFKAATGFSFHFLELVPMVLLTAGLLGFYRSLKRPDRGLGTVGGAVAVAGAATATAGHGVEHVLFHLGNPLGAAFAGAHYLGLVLVALGLTVAALPVDRSILAWVRERVLLLSTVPVGLVLAAVLGTLWFRGFADGFKLQVAAVVAVTGYRLWRQSSDIDPAGTGARSDLAQ